ncbi:hypothetical protein BT69DRAFT_1358480, partial [Atractiella rhizophila]
MRLFPKKKEKSFSVIYPPKDKNSLSADGAGGGEESRYDWDTIIGRAKEKPVKSSLKKTSSRPTPAAIELPDPFTVKPQELSSTKPTTAHSPTSIPRSSSPLVHSNTLTTSSEIGASTAPSTAPSAAVTDGEKEDEEEKEGDREKAER